MDSCRKCGLPVPKAKQDRKAEAPQHKEGECPTIQGAAHTSEIPAFIDFRRAVVEYRGIVLSSMREYAEGLERGSTNLEHAAAAARDAAQAILDLTEAYNREAVD